RSEEESDEVMMGAAGFEPVFLAVARSGPIAVAQRKVQKWDHVTLVSRRIRPYRARVRRIREIPESCAASRSVQEDPVCICFRSRARRDQQHWTGADPLEVLRVASRPLAREQRRRRT